MIDLEDEMSILEGFEVEIDRFFIGKCRIWEFRSYETMYVIFYEYMIL